MAELKELLIKVLENYKREVKLPFPGNGNMKKLIGVELPDKLKTIIIDTRKILLFKGGIGKGQWATVPWIAVLDKNLTTTVSKGVYIVYLFCADGSGVYLTLNQGTGGINEARILPNHEITRNEYLSRAHSLDNFSKGVLEPNSLKGKKNPRAKAYEQASILWKYYSIENLKTKLEEEVLENNLKDLLKIYTNKDIQEKKVNNNVKFNYNNFYEELLKSRYKFNKYFVLRFISALCTKPFLILTGLSGSGKTKLAQAFTYWITENGKQYCLIPVGADWTNREPLLGFPNSLEPGKYIKPENRVIDLIIEAGKEANADKPFFLILDEMNLSHVERYFADFLSVMESNEKISLHSDIEWLDNVPVDLTVPKNLFIIGTVNVDETTYMFSPKVLDRAHVIEFRVNEEEMENFLKEPLKPELELLKGLGKDMASDFIRKSQSEVSNFEEIADVQTTLIQFFKELKKIGAEFGYRSASEIYRFAGILKMITKENGNEWSIDDIIDAAVIQKLLPKVHGSRSKLEPILKTLAELCLIDKNDFNLIIKGDNIDFADKTKIKYPLTFEKILRMRTRVIQDGFTSFAEA